MRVHFDTNLLLDVLFSRLPHDQDSKALWEAHEAGTVEAFLTATSVTNIFYIARHLAGVEKARESIILCLNTFEICIVDRGTLELAASKSGSDFEDDVQIACAEREGRDAIVTRDRGGFGGASLPVYSPAELLAHLSGPQNP
jgi:predicted nucleic acid-binding protein